MNKDAKNINRLCSCGEQIGVEKTDIEGFEVARAALRKASWATWATWISEAAEAKSKFK